MKVPISWLKEYIDVDFSTEELADKLIFSGIEVEGIETVGSSFEGIVVGEVLSIEKHPNADRLRLCRVSNGTEELPVVCGATNFEVGDKIPFAGVGVQLAEDFKIKKAKIRGEVSEGMLCAEDELGVSDDHEGIMLLSRDIAAGTALVDVLGAPEEVIDLEITWNRSDCLSIIGVAREVAALFDANMKVPSIDFSKDASSVASDLVKVSIDDAADCQRYTARMLSGIKLGPSPVWMQKRIELCGIRPINNVVDITNYVMLESGQPLHAFDFTKVSGGEIKVRRARDGEVMKTLDDVERKLDVEMLVIADKDDAVALAGVMGGAGSEISEQTEKVLLESALFDPALIHTVSNRMGLSSESSHRFERSVDSERVEWASRRATQLMVEHAGASVSEGMVDCKPIEVEQAVVVCRYQKVWDLLGFKIDKDEIVSIFNRLTLPVIAQDDDSCTVQSPTFRHDIKIEADLIEEVIRMHGLENVPDVDLIARIVPGADDKRSRAVREFRGRVIGLGFCECMHYSFVSERLLNLFDANNVDSRV
ncbi:MAG: phenylalanine--tRNA ligase subunit beta, partial [Kiritimatiellae bacterium]|nr:phenylalanine--tRNA ligase subunit beta [Kiritimatiellia bacterium]